MTRKLTDVEKAARAVARRAATSQRKFAQAEREADAEAERPFNVRSTRESVRRSLLKGAALTLEQHRIAEARGLIGSGITNEPGEAMPIAYDGAHQVRWDSSSWQGFTRLSVSREINNSNDTYDPVAINDGDPGDTIDDDVVEDEDIFNRWQEDDYWAELPDVYDSMCDAAGGQDLTEMEYLRLWHSQVSKPR